MTPSSPARGRLEVLAAGLRWSLGGVVIKSIAAPAAVIAATRSLFAALVFFPFVRRRPAASVAVTLASTLAYTGVVGLFVWSTKMTTAANAIILQYTAPAWVFLIAWLSRGERPERRDLVTLAGGLIGITVIYLGSAAGDLPGISLAVLSGILFAAWMVLTHSARDLDPAAMTFVNNLGAVALLLPIALLGGGGWPTPMQALALAVMGTVQLGIPYLLFSRGVRSLRSQEASLIVLVEPVLNPLWVALVAGERPAPATFAGGVIILLTLALRYVVPLVRAAPAST